MSILLAASLPPDERQRWAEALRAALPGESLLLDRHEADATAIDVAIVAQPPPGALAGLPRLRLVQSLWAGVEGLLADASLPAAVPLARMVDPQMNRAMAETALWAVLGLHRGGFEHARRQARAEWAPVAQERADEVGVAVLGLGQMGATVARRLADNGYRVTGWSLGPKALEGIECRHGLDALDAVLGANRVVVNLLPLTPATRGLFDARRLAQLPRGAGLVNLARGAHVVEADLLAALDAGALGHAVLDVFAVEPLPAGHAFWRHPRVTVWPHAAAQTDLRSAAAIAAANVRALREGRALAHLVDRVRGY